jgi:flagellar motility protein MotE (MotC chaperone)
MIRMTGAASFDEIAWLRANSPAWRLLRADSAPLVLSFLHRVFVEDNVRSIAAIELASRLDDELYSLNERSPRSFPKSAKAYLDDWASPESGWLRKYYIEGTDEPWFDATPAAEKALQWVRGLEEREFVGTESRLNTIFDLLRQIVFGTETDPAARIKELRRQQRQIDDEIARIEAGDLFLLDSSGVRDRYQQFSATARELLADFREVEENFRKLDRQLREKIAGWHGGKGELLDDVLGSRESIAGSDQGRSFQGFYDFLLSRSRQEELSDLLARVHQVADTAERDPRLQKVHYDWLDAAERTQATVRQLSEQLRRFLDDQVWFENRRVIDLLRGIEARALKLRDARDQKAAALTLEIDAPGPEIRLPMERPLYTPVRKPRIDSSGIRPAGEDDKTDPTALFEQVYVDPGPLRQAVRAQLRRAPQVGLADLVRAAPLTHGVAELVTYLSLRDDAFAVVYDETRTERVSWTDPEGRGRTATLPKVTFTRARAQTPGRGSTP